MKASKHHKVQRRRDQIDDNNEGNDEKMPSIIAHPAQVSSQEIASCSFVIQTIHVNFSLFTVCTKKKRRLHISETANFREA